MGRLRTRNQQNVHKTVTVDITMRSAVQTDRGLTCSNDLQGHSRLSGSEWYSRV